MNHASKFSKLFTERNKVLNNILNKKSKIIDVLKKKNRKDFSDYKDLYPVDSRPQFYLKVYRQIHEIK